MRNWIFMGQLFLAMVIGTWIFHVWMGDLTFPADMLVRVVVYYCVFVVELALTRMILRLRRDGSERQTDVTPWFAVTD